MKNIASIGQKIYQLQHHQELKRYIIFRIRAFFNSSRMDRINSYFQQDDIRSHIADIYPFVYEQPQRAFFFNRSKFDERILLLQEHFDCLLSFFPPNVVYDLYSRKNIILWQTSFEGTPLELALHYEPGQRKEGIMSVTLFWGERRLYQMIFWLAKTPQLGAASSAYNLYIGAMQGPNGEEPKELIKRMTKFCHGYRTKNLILYATQAAARAMGLSHIYAVTNDGYYAMNHVRIDRKLKTSFTDFWDEVGGTPLKDKRFYELPLTEARKSPEEIPTRKRALYRRRFTLLDEIDESIEMRIRDMRK